MKNTFCIYSVFFLSFFFNCIALAETPPLNPSVVKPKTEVDKMTKEEDITYDQGTKEVTDFITYYYLHPQPQRAGVMLKTLLNSSLFAEGGPDNSHSLDTTAYFFSRIAQLEPSIVDDYINIFKEATHEQRCYVLKILQVCGNRKVVDFFESNLKQNNFAEEKKRIDYAIQTGIPISFNPLTRPVREGGDLDYLWMEYMATGKEDPVLKVIETLKDYNSRDQNLFIIAKVAEWSLDSFCRQHEKVMEICKNRIPKLEGIARERIENVINEIEIEKLPDLIPINKMIKAVVRKLTPVDKQKSADSSPIAFYRIGSKFWRVDKYNGLVKIIVKEPDIWIIETDKNEGIHFVGPFYKNYFFPIIHSKDNKVILRGLQLGTELQFMEAKKCQKKFVQHDGEDCILYTVDTENVQVELLCKQRKPKQIPWKLTVSEEKTLLFSCVYDEYSLDLEIDMSLFEIPKDMNIKEDTSNHENKNEIIPTEDRNKGLNPFIKDRLPKELRY